VFSYFRDEFEHRKNEFRPGRFLSNFAVESEFNVGVSRDFVWCGDNRTHWRRVIEGFAPHPVLLDSLILPVGDIVEASKTRDYARRISLVDFSALLTDYYTEFGLVLDVIDTSWKVNG